MVLSGEEAWLLVREGYAWPPMWTGSHFSSLWRTGFMWPPAAGRISHEAAHSGATLSVASFRCPVSHGKEEIVTWQYFRKQKERQLCLFGKWTILELQHDSYPQKKSFTKLIRESFIRVVLCWAWMNQRKMRRGLCLQSPECHKSDSVT